MNRSMPALLRGSGPLLGLLVTYGLFACTAGSTFTSLGNLELMLLQTAVVGIAALGATWVILSGGIDLSVGSTIAVSGMVGALALRSGSSWWSAMLISIAVGGGIGGLIGTMVTGAMVRTLLSLAAGSAVLLALPHAPPGDLPNQAAGAWPPLLRAALTLGAAAAAWRLSRRITWSLPLSPFIVTLGAFGALRGLAKGLGGNQPVYFPRNEALASWMLPGGLWLAPSVWLLLAATTGAAVLLRRTVFGRHALAFGANRQAARLAGIDTKHIEISVYAIAGVCGGIAAVLQLSFLSMGDPTTAQGHELKAIAAAVIGGASLAGGSGSMFGTLVGALVMTVVDNGCTKLGLDNWVQEIATGAIIVGAVALDRWRQRS